MRSGTISALACPCTPSSASIGLQACRHFGRSVNPISTRGTDYAHLINTGNWIFIPSDGPGLQRGTGQSFSRKSNYKSLASAELVLLRTWKFSRVYTNSKRVQGTLRGGGGGGGGTVSSKQQCTGAMPRCRDALYS